MIGRRSSDECLGNLIEALQEMKNDMESGKFTSPSDYCDVYRTGNFNTKLVLGLKEDVTPTDVRRRAEFIIYFRRLQAFYYKYRNAKPDDKSNEQTNAEPSTDVDNVEYAIRLLKKNGYKVMKQTVEYVEV